MVYRKLKELHELDNNPRKITKDKFKILCQSIKDNKEYFEARPLILSDRTGQLVIIAGNQRYKAAKELGLEEAPTYLISGLTLEKENEIVIRDNINNGEWDYDMLANEWETEELISWGLDIPGVSESFKPKELELKPFKRTHVLLSFPPEKMAELQHLLQQITAFSFVEYEQSNN